MTTYWLKRGGRTDSVCSVCGSTIPKSTPHFWTTLGKRYHDSCKPGDKPRTETPIIEPQVSEVVTETSTELTETSETPSSVEEVPLLRNRLGQFVKKS